MAQNSKSTIRKLHQEALKLADSSLDSAIAKVEAAKVIIENVRDEWALATNKSVEARIYMLNRQDGEAYSAFLSALKSFTGTDTVDIYNPYLINRNLAIIANRNGFYDEAIIHYDSAFHLLLKISHEMPTVANKLNSPMAFADIKYFKARSLKRSGRIGEAGQELIKILEEQEFKPNTKSRLRALNQIGLIKKDIEEYEEAKAFFNQIVESKDASNYAVAQALHNLANINLLTTNFEQSKKQFEEAIVILKEILSTEDKPIYRRQLFISQLDLGELNFRREKGQEAIQNWLTALDTYDNIAGNPEYYIIHDWLLKAYLSSDPKLAGYHNEMYMSYNQSYIHTREEVAEVLKKQLFENQIAKFEQKQQQEERLAAQRKSLLFYLYLLSALSLVVGTSLFWYFKVYRKNRTFQDMVKVANWDAVPDSEPPGKL